jgi:hypothetical protein
LIAGTGIFAERLGKDGVEIAETERGRLDFI